MQKSVVETAFGLFFEFEIDSQGFIIEINNNFLEFRVYNLHFLAMFEILLLFSWSDKDEDHDDSNERNGDGSSFEEYDGDDEMDRNDDR